MQMLANEFNYSELDVETQVLLRQRTSEIRSLVKRSASSIIEIGEKLAEVRDRLANNRPGKSGKAFAVGGFEGWLKVEFDWVPMTAYRFINVWESLGQGNHNLLDLDRIAPSALYLLCKPSAPTEAREAAVKMAEAGLNVSHKTAKQLTKIAKDDWAEGCTKTVANPDSPWDGQQVTISEVDDIIIEAVLPDGTEATFLKNEFEEAKPKPRAAPAPKPNPLETLEIQLQVAKSRIRVLESWIASALDGVASLDEAKRLLGRD